MKIIRKPVVEVPAPAPVVKAEPDSNIDILAAVARSTNEMLAEVAQATAQIADKLQSVTAERKPVSFTCVVTKRDESGRISAMEIRPKRDT